MKTYLRVLEAVESAGVKAWLVGDPVRTITMGLCPMVLTVVTEPCDLNLLAVSLGGTVTGAENFPLVRVTLFGNKVEIICLEKGFLIEDELARRDFSMNAIAMRRDGGVIDPFGGRQDIRNGLIRLTGDDVGLVKSDPIRVVRMLRFAAELDMDIFWKSETDIRVFLTQNPDAMKNTPAERWGREILNGMRRRPHDFVYLCDRYGLMPFFLEDLEKLKSIPIEGGQNLFAHTLDTLRVVQEFLSRRKHRDSDMALSLAALFHHSGSETGHPIDMRVAARAAARRLKTWNVPTELVETVEAVIENYRIPYTALSEEELCRAVLKHGLDVIEMVADFAICNSQADKMKNMEVLVANKWKLGEVIRRFEEARYKTGGSSRYLSGDEVMGTLKLSPGKKVGELLLELDLAVGMGVVSSKREATEWILKRGVS